MKQTSSLIALLLCCSFFALASKPGFAGTTGMLSGNVYECGPPGQCHRPSADSQRAAVTVTGPGGRLETTAGASGFFAFVSLVPGTYYVFARQPNFYQNCGAIVRISADQMTNAVVTVRADRVLGLRCYGRVGRPSSNTPTWSLGPDGNFEF
jgi:hypothetical protein